MVHQAFAKLSEESHAQVAQGAVAVALPSVSLKDVTSLALEAAAAGDGGRCETGASRACKHPPLPCNGCRRDAHGPVDPRYLFSLLHVWWYSTTPKELCAHTIAQHIPTMSKSPSSAAGLSMRWRGNQAQSCTNDSMLNIDMEMRSSARHIGQPEAFGT